MSSTRRDFLKQTLGASTLLALGPTVPTFLSRSAEAGAVRRDARDTILVVIEMAGGNDGLNTIIPYDDDEYVRARPTLRRTPDDVLKIDEQFGFHPRMVSFPRLLKEGHLSILHGIGYPNQSGDHAVSMDVWQSAAMPEANCQTGWLGRTVDSVVGEDSVEAPAVYVGSSARPLALNAQRSVVPSHGSFDDFGIRQMPGDGGGADHRERLTKAAQVARDGADPLLDFVRRSALSAYAAGDRIEAAAATTARTGPYPNMRFARDLRTIARLIRADMGIRIYYAHCGGGDIGAFDNHANQRGNHGALLNQLSESMAAFSDDLAGDNLLDRVVMMTFSEFGRTVKENGRRGTGHGSAAPMFLAGGRVKGGFHGEHPPLTGELENGGQKSHTDFRRVYATLLERWLGFDSLPILGERFELLDVLDV